MTITNQVFEKEMSMSAQKCNNVIPASKKASKERAKLLLSSTKSSSNLDFANQALSLTAD